jgi:hypothetical protein
MTARRKPAVAALSAALAAIGFLAGGCGVVVGSNEAACRRVVNRIVECDFAFPFADFSDASDLRISRFCEGVPETSQCGEWLVFADRVTSSSCDHLGSDPLTIVNLDNIVSRLESGGCFPRQVPVESFDSPDSGPGNSACEPLTGFEGCLLTGTCPDDCPE